MNGYNIDADPFSIPTLDTTTTISAPDPATVPDEPDADTPAKTGKGRPKWTLDPEYADDVHAVCRRLQEHIQSQLTEGQRRLIKIDQRWERTAQLMLKKDAYTREQIEAVIDWATNDDFWAGNVRTMEGLRRHFLTISMRVEFRDWARRNNRSTITATQPVTGRGTPYRPAMPLTADETIDKPKGIYEERIR